MLDVCHFIWWLFSHCYVTDFIMWFFFVLSPAETLWVHKLAFTLSHRWQRRIQGPACWLAKISLSHLTIRQYVWTVWVRFELLPFMLWGSNANRYAAIIPITKDKGSATHSALKILETSPPTMAAAFWISWSLLITMIYTRPFQK